MDAVLAVHQVMHHRPALRVLGGRGAAADVRVPAVLVHRQDVEERDVGARLDRLADRRDGPGARLADDHPGPLDDGLAEELREPLVEPGRELVPEERVGELVEALVLDHVQDALARHALGPEREPGAAAGDEEHARGPGPVHAELGAQGVEVVLLAPEHQHRRVLRRLPAQPRAVDEPAHELVVHDVEVVRVGLGLGRLEVAADRVVAGRRQPPARRCRPGPPGSHRLRTGGRRGSPGQQGHQQAGEDRSEAIHAPRIGTGPRGPKESTAGTCKRRVYRPCRVIGRWSQEKQPQTLACPRNHGILPSTLDRNREP